MLVIRRREGESLVIQTPSGPVEIGIFEISPTRVKIGIQAPDDVHILRKEMLLAQAQNRAAAEALSPEAIGSLLGQARS
ncbi:MAG: carbon storage regulator [Bryobacteraceae bacterium]